MSSAGLSCPSGGSFYACGDGSRFVGCCQANPCSSTGCAAGALDTASFDPSDYGLTPDQQCDAGLFYTCAETDPPFWGCCKSNPCSGSGCPAVDLAGAFLSNNPSDAQVFLALNSTWESQTTISASASGLSITTASTGTAAVSLSETMPLASPTTTSLAIGESAVAATTSPVSISQSTNPSSSSFAGPLAGGIVGGLAVIAALILGILYLRRRKTRPGGPQNRFAGMEPMRHIAEPDEGTGAGAKDSAAVWSSSVGSPQPQYSPRPPSYHSPMLVSYELPGATAGQEMDSGQHYHPYRQGGTG